MIQHPLEHKLGHKPGNKLLHNLGHTTGPRLFFGVNTHSLKPETGKQYYSDGLFNSNRLYQLAEKFVTARERAMEACTARQAQIRTRLEKLPKSQVLKRLLLQTSLRLQGVQKWWASRLLDFDFQEFSTLGKNKSIHVASLPLGTLIVLLYVSTMVPRTRNAYLRGKENNNDFREVYDVLRRDGTALTVLLFLFQPLVLALNKLRENMSGVPLLTGTAKSIWDRGLFTYSQLGDTYGIYQEQSLAKLLQNGHKKPLLKAAASNRLLSDEGLSLAPGGKQTLNKHIRQFRQLLETLVTQVDKKAPAQQIADTSKKAYQELLSMDTLRQSLATQTQQAGNPSLLKGVRRLKPFREFYARYTKIARLPADILAFLIAIVGVGYLPVAFNDYWNRLQYNRHQSSEQAHTPLKRAQMFQQLSAGFKNHRHI